MSVYCSLPISKRFSPFLRSSLSNSACVAIPAWSIPGIQFTFRSCMRWKRTMASWISAISDNAIPQSKRSVHVPGANDR